MSWKQIFFDKLSYMKGTEGRRSEDLEIAGKTRHLQGYVEILELLNGLEIK